MSEETEQISPSSRDMEEEVTSTNILSSEPNENADVASQNDSDSVELSRALRHFYEEMEGLRRTIFPHVSEEAWEAHLSSLMQERFTRLIQDVDEEISSWERSIVQGDNPNASDVGDEDTYREDVEIVQIHETQRDVQPDQSEQPVGNDDGESTLEMIREGILDVATILLLPFNPDILVSLGETLTRSEIVDSMTSNGRQVFERLLECWEQSVEPNIIINSAGVFNDPSIYSLVVCYASVRLLEVSQLTRTMRRRIRESSDRDGQVPNRGLTSVLDVFCDLFVQSRFSQAWDECEGFQS